jgi:tRNA pseudouridine13 synthase
VADAAQFSNPEFEVLQAHRHRRKLPRGALAGNAFTIRIRDYTGSSDQLRQGCESIMRSGVPNYFGPQRFGREAGNLARLAGAPGGAGAGAGAARSPNRPDSFILSAARSLIFNAVVGARVRDGTWGTLAVGDVANLDGRGSVFPVAELTPDLPERLAQLEVHPTGPMWGMGELMSRGSVLDLEQRIGLELAPACQFVVDAGLRQERRSLRLRVRDLGWEHDADGVVLRFWLRSGSFATAVLRELIADGSRPDQAGAADSRVVDADDV